MSAAAAMRSSACRKKSLNVFMQAKPAVRSRSYTLKDAVGRGSKR